MQCTSAIDAKKRMTAVIEWTESQPVGAGVCVKKLTNKGIHTFVGMVLIDRWWPLCTVNQLIDKQGHGLKPDGSPVEMLTVTLADIEMFYSGCLACSHPVT
ncbi:hypothetical protein R1sor_020730 [Riccia sorocarpa]|uniref:Uncharacterized protein n=1 Tax=Riccia sorocarpa TaxID=122646 RepID=A0ABD3GH47_9MARC